MNKELSIRKAESGDLEAVLGILRNQIGEEYFEDVRQEFLDLDTGKAHGFAAEENQRIVGYASWRKKAQVAYLETIAVMPEYQGKLTGSELLKRVKEDIKQKMPDIKILNVVTDADATRTIGFYLKNGFVVSGTVNEEFVPGTSQVHLTLKL